MHPTGLVRFLSCLKQGTSPNSESILSMTIRSFKGPSGLKYTDQTKQIYWTKVQ